ncbi:MAG: YbaB/EbfC family nucleoid-associated protein [Segniliparus sp.]|uniref:YbaB/EbfC family nucleoid-associated protein n=1 Tax=Segniliparus sp. TaxID=2804064 RepID=UPI003F3880E4
MTGPQTPAAPPPRKLATPEDFMPQFGVDVNEVIRLAKARLEKMYATEHALKNIHVRHTSEDEACTVEVDGMGKLLSLSLNHKISNMSGPEVGELVSKTCADAARSALIKFNEIVDEFNDTIHDDTNFSRERYPDV